MKENVLLLLFYISIVACGQKKQSEDVITNIITDNHRNVIGTKVSLVPPEDFSQATNFNGFLQSESNSSIMVIEMPGSFDEVSRSITKANLKTQGLNLINKQDLNINGYSGIYIQAEQFAYGKMFNKYILAFGTDSNTVMINGTFPNDVGNQISDDIQKSLFSAVYESNKKVNPLENVGFEVNVLGTKLKFAKVISNSVVYTVDGKVPTEANDKSNLLVSSSLGQIIVEDKKQYSINRLKKIPTIQEIEPIEIKNISIDNLQGFEIIAYGINKKDKDKEMIYQVMLFSDTSYYLIIGTTRDNFDENLLIFKKICSTFRRK